MAHLSINIIQGLPSWSGLSFVALEAPLSRFHTFVDTGFTSTLISNITLTILIFGTQDIWKARNSWLYGLGIAFHYIASSIYLPEHLQPIESCEAHAFAAAMVLLEKQWVNVQEKTFTKWSL